MCYPNVIEQSVHLGRWQELDEPSVFLCLEGGVTPCCSGASYPRNDWRGLQPTMAAVRIRAHPTMNDDGSIHCLIHRWRVRVPSLVAPAWCGVGALRDIPEVTAGLPQLHDLGSTPPFPNIGPKPGWRYV